MTNSRRNFFKTTGTALAGLAASPLISRAQSAPAMPPANIPAVPEIAGGAKAREYWVAMARKVAAPVLENLAARTLKKNMPFEMYEAPGRDAAKDRRDRMRFTHTEAICRLMCGITAWIETDKPADIIELVHKSLDAMSDPESPDYMNFKTPSQPLVEAAFICQGLLRARKTLWEPLDARVKKNFIASMNLARKIAPFENNWQMFAAEVEAFMHAIGEDIDRKRVSNALERHEKWYKGDGVYGDGNPFHWDYYNSYSIQPMLLDTTEVFAKDAEWKKYRAPVVKRARRYAAVLERFISPEGTYPIIGRSSGYRCGALQVLTQIALQKRLPKNVSPAQVRCALTKVLQRQLGAAGTFDKDGWLQLGFAGHQPAVADPYVTTGSNYLCSPMFLVLGLPADDEFWSAPDEPWTSVKAWSGVNIPGDHSV